jgi:fumarate reductase flavoprotein subunit
VRIIVVGGGLAGLVATLRATQLGARVTLLEKGDRLGGSLTYSSGYIWSYRDLEVYRQEAPGGDPNLHRLILERLEEGLDWLEDLGVTILTRETGNPLPFGARLDPKQTVATLAQRINASEGRILMGTALEGLLEDPKAA